MSMTKEEAKEESLDDVFQKDVKHLRQWARELTLSLKQQDVDGIHEAVEAISSELATLKTRGVL